MKEHMSSRGSRYNSLKLKQTIVLSDKLVFLTFTALLTEIVCMYQMKGTANLGVFDLLPMTTLFQGSLIENLLAWLIPLLASLICGKQFNTYYPVRNSIFTRVKRRSFVMKLAKSAVLYPHRKDCRSFHADGSINVSELFWRPASEFL